MNDAVSLDGVSVRSGAGSFAPLDACLRLGVESADGVALLRAFIANARKQREYAPALLATLLLGKAYYQRGELGPARAHGIAAAELARQTGDDLAEAHAHKWLALVAFDEGRSRDGHDHLLDALAGFMAAKCLEELPTLTRWYGEHLLFLGAHEEAERALQLARVRCLAIGDARGAQAIQADLQALAARVGTGN